MHFPEKVVPGRIVLIMHDMSKDKIFTKRPMVLMSSFRLRPPDVALLRRAAVKEKISQSEFLRRAVKDRATGILKDDELEQG